MNETPPSRGVSSTTVRQVRCKDCLRERARGGVDPQAPQTDEQEQFAYNEDWAQQLLDRGGSRTDRCSRHRRIHTQAIQGIAVAYIDIKTLGEVRDLKNPTGPLGGLGPMPETHKAASMEVDLAEFKFGMNDDHIREMLDKLSDPNRRVLILKAGTGTGKSTFGPFRLMFPPDESSFKLADLGQMVVTEPRVPATTGVARYVGERLVMGCRLKECTNPSHGSFNPKAHKDDPDGQTGQACGDETCVREHVGDHPGPELEGCVVVDCSRHIGPGYRVGYQVANDKNHDPACQIVYVTDGTMINWLREGRLSSIGTVIVDEAHERSTNIDFILGYLRREIDRYPHLRVIVTSATFDVDFYVDYFGGSDKVHQMDVPAEKSFGYGAPLFPRVDDGAPLDCGCEPRRETPEAELLPLHPPLTSYAAWLDQHWPLPNDATADRPSSTDMDPDSHAEIRRVTELLHELRARESLPFPADGKPDKDWREGAGRAVASHAVHLVRSLQEIGVHGDVLAFLPNVALIATAVETIREQLDPDLNDVFALTKDAPSAEKEAAQASRPLGAKRKIVIATNLAETSLTISGVRFVIDAGMNTQGEWDAALATKTIPTKLHSQSGIRQRWGRVGRDAPGWVFPLYSKADFETLPADTPPGSTRDNLEQLVMKAKAGGIDDVATFQWPATHVVAGKTTEDLDPRVVATMDTFAKELVRADAALISSGAVDDEGHLTEFGKELDRFGQFSGDFAVATMLADQLTCVPEVVTALAVLDAQKPQAFQDLTLRNLALRDQGWPGEWLWCANEQWQHLWRGCRDDFAFVLRVFSLWERADPDVKPWIRSPKREAWAAQWWINNETLLLGAELRRSVLESLSPAMKEEVKRFLEPELAPRARAVISRAYNALRHMREDSGLYRAEARPDDVRAGLVSSVGATRPEPPLEDVIPLSRQRGLDPDVVNIDNIVETVPWACDPSLSAMDLMLLCRDRCNPSTLKPHEYDQVIEMAAAYPAGSIYRITEQGSRNEALELVALPFTYPGEPTAYDPVESAFEANGEGSSADQQVVYSTTTGDAWPTGNPFPQEDEVILERRQLVDVETADRDSSTGRALGPESNDDAFDGPTTTMLAASSVGVGDVRWEIRGADTQEHCVCSGYVLGKNPKVILTWQSAREVVIGDLAAAHHGLEDGQQVTVIVGDTLEVPILGRWKTTLLELIRSDGEGRFLVAPGRSGTANPPAALDRNDRGFLERLSKGEMLTGTVVPTKYGTYAWSLIPVLSSHLDAAHKAGLTDPTDKNWYWPGRIAGEPNDNGWVPVEILSRDVVRGVIHTFGVRVAVLDAALEDYAPDTAVSIVLRSNSATLVGPRDVLTGVFERHERAFKRDDMSSLETITLKSGRPIPLGVVHDLLQEIPDEPQWTVLVWNFYLESHLRYVGGVAAGSESEPIPSPIGEGLPRGSQPASANNVRLSVDVPSHLAALIRKLRPAIADRLGVEVSTDGVNLVAHFPNRETADAASGRLRTLLSGPCLHIGIPADRKSAVIGSRGKNINQLAAIGGVLFCNFSDDDPNGLIICSENSGSARDCISELMKLIHGVRAVMQIPVSGSVGALFGQQGAKIKELNSMPGITRINTGERGSRSWIISAHDADSVYDLVRFASLTVPGCTAAIEEGSAPRIIDLSTGAPIADWRTDVLAETSTSEIRTDVPDSHGPENEVDSPDPVDVQPFMAGRDAEPAVTELGEREPARFSADELVGKFVIKFDDSGRAMDVLLQQGGQLKEWSLIRDPDAKPYHGTWTCSRDGHLHIVVGEYDLDVTPSRTGLHSGVERTATRGDIRFGLIVCTDGLADDFQANGQLLITESRLVRVLDFESDGSVGAHDPFSADGGPTVGQHELRGHSLNAAINIDLPGLTVELMYISTRDRWWGLAEQEGVGQFEAFMFDILPRMGLASPNHQPPTADPGGDLAVRGLADGATAGRSTGWLTDNLHVDSPKTSKLNYSGDSLAEAIATAEKILREDLPPSEYRTLNPGRMAGLFAKRVVERAQIEVVVRRGNDNYPDTRALSGRLKSITATTHHNPWGDGEWVGYLVRDLAGGEPTYMATELGHGLGGLVISARELPDQVVRQLSPGATLGLHRRADGQQWIATLASGLEFTFGNVPIPTSDDLNDRLGSGGVDRLDRLVRGGAPVMAAVVLVLYELPTRRANEFRFVVGSVDSIRALTVSDA